MNAARVADLALARRVLETEAAAVAALVDRLDARFEHAVRLLLDCKGRVIVTGMGNRGVQLRDAATATVACTNSTTVTGNLMFRDSIFWNNGASGSTNCGNHSTTGPDANCNSCQLYDLWKANSPGPVVENDPGLSGSSWPANPSR